MRIMSPSMQKGGGGREREKVQLAHHGEEAAEGSAPLHCALLSERECHGVTQSVAPKKGMRVMSPLCRGGGGEVCHPHRWQGAGQ